MPRPSSLRNQFAAALLTVAAAGARPHARLSNCLGLSRFGRDACCVLSCPRALYHPLSFANSGGPCEPVSCLPQVLMTMALHFLHCTARRTSHLSTRLSTCEEVILCHLQSLCKAPAIPAHT